MQAIKCMSYSENDLFLPYNVTQKVSWWAMVLSERHVENVATIQIAMLIVHCQTCLLISYTTNAFPVSPVHAAYPYRSTHKKVQGEYIPTGTFTTDELAQSLLMWMKSLIITLRT